MVLRSVVSALEDRGATIRRAGGADGSDVCGAFVDLGLVLFGFSMAAPRQLTVMSPVGSGATFRRTP
jgi:hypothetical protein